MRQLTVSQKKLLDKAMVENPSIQTVDDLPIEVWEKLEELNDTEILWQETNRYLTDAYYKREFSS